MIKFQNNKINSKGYSTLELLLATAVGAIVIGGSFSAYTIIGNQQKRVSAFSEVQSAGMPTVRLIARDLRMAGRLSLDSNIDPVYGIISTPITINDSGDDCCDSIVITYDHGTEDDNNSKRCQITYSTDERTDPDRTALYREVTTTNSNSGETCIGDGQKDLVTDYVDDLQFVGSDNDNDGNPMLVDISLLLRSKNMLKTQKTYTPPDEVVGNYNYSFTDKYHRDEFTITVNIKNLRN